MLSSNMKNEQQKLCTKKVRSKGTYHTEK